MAASTEPDGTGRRRAAWIWVAAGAAVLVALVIAVALWPRGEPVAGSTASTGSARPSASASAEATATPTPPAEGEPTPPAEAPPVGFGDEVEALPGVRFSLAQLESVDGEAQGRGEVAGPALRFGVDVANDTAESVPLGTTVVNVYYGSDRTPAQNLTGPSVEPFPAEVGAGDAASGVFVFAVPLEERDEVSITVDYAVGVPIVVFQGAAPG